MDGSPENKTRDPDAVIQDIRSQLAKSERKIDRETTRVKKFRKGRAVFFVIMCLLVVGVGWYYLSGKEIHISIDDRIVPKTSKVSSIYETARSFSAPMLWEEFQTNEVKAKHDYISKAIKVSGKIMSITSGQDGEFVVGLAVSSSDQTDSSVKVYASLSSINCKFSSDEFDSILTLRVNSSATIVGLCSSVSTRPSPIGVVGVDLINCKLLN